MTDMTALDFTIENVPDDWEALASAGREVMQHMDTGRWLAGDLANRVTRTYGKRQPRQVRGRHRDCSAGRRSTTYRARYRHG